MPWILKEPRMKSPRGGWRWEESGAEIVEAGPEALAQKIQRMRARGGRPPGDPMGEICEKLAESDPWLVRFIDPDTNRPEKNDSLFDKVDAWLSEVSAKAADFAYSVDAQSRAKTCAGCPHNVHHPYPKGSQGRYKRKLMIATRGHCDRYPKLGFCDHFLHDNRMAILLKEPHRRTGCCGGDRPEGCWA